MTFCFTDIAGSTDLFRQLGEQTYTALLDRHRVLIRAAVAQAGGTEVSTEGDGFFLAFDDPASAVRFAVDAQRAIAGEAWPAPVQVRMGLHSGPAQRRADGDFVALAVHRAARVVSAAHGGQVLLTEELADLAPPGCSTPALGQYLLRDFDDPVPLRQLRGPGLADGFPPPRAARVLHGLPIPRTSLVGRAGELRRLRHDITPGQLLTVVGPGGVGKSRLCLEAMAELASSYTDGVHLVELSAVADPEAVLGTALAALGAVPRPDQDPLDTLVHALQGSRLLLLDSCERCLDGVAPVVKELLDRYPGLALLATSAEPVRVPGERQLALEPLPVPAEEALDAEAVQLLHQRAVAGGATYDLVEVGAQLAQIARRLDGIPLALELAANRIVELGVEQVVSGLEDRFALLTNGFRTALPRHRTLESMVAWTVDLLAEQDREVFGRICCLDGRWPLAHLPAAVGLPPDAVVSIRRLADRSLVSFQDAESRVRILDTVRLFGRRQAGPAVLADARAALTAHLGARNWHEWAASVPEMERLAELGAIVPDLRSLLADPPPGHERDLDVIAGAVYSWFENRGLFREALTLLRGLMKGREHAGAKVMVTAASAALALGEVDDAEQLARQALEAPDTQPDARAVACEVLDQLGATLADGGDPLELALQLTAVDPRGTASMSARARWSFRLLSRGQPQAALAVVDDLIELADQGQHVSRECNTRQMRATIEMSLGRLDEAEAELGRVQDLIERFDLMVLRGPCLTTRIGVALRRGDLPAAIELAEARIALAQAGGDAKGELSALSYVVTAASALGDLARARAAGERAIELSTRLRRLDGVIIGRFNLVVVETDDGRSEAARSHAAQALALAQPTGVPPFPLLALGAAIGVLCRERDQRGLTLAAVFERLTSGPDAVPTPMDPPDHEWLQSAIAQAQGLDESAARAAAEGMDLAAALELAAAALELRG